MSLKSAVLIILQVSCFFYFAFFHPILTSGVSLGVQVVAFFFCLWSMLVLRIGNFNVQPEVKQGAELIQKGPYKVIRNPIYTGILIFLTTTVIYHFSLPALGILLLLTVVFVLKIGSEEKFLVQYFGEPYTEYLQRTWRMIPFVY